MKDVKNIAIIFAGGSGARMGSGIPKQFLEVDNKPILIHTLEIFDEHPEIDEIYVACREDYIPQLQKLVKKFMLMKVAGIVAGGATGQDSIYNGLMAAKANNENAIVLIHDGVRPCINDEVISNNIKSVKEYGTAITCTSMFETPVSSKDGKKIDFAPPRNEFYTAQAPQSFYLNDILAVHDETRSKNPSYDGIVDSCSLMRASGKEVYIVEGPRGNIKVTTPEDLYIFRAMREYKQSVSIFGLSKKEVKDNLKNN